MKKADKLTDTQKEILKAFASADMRISETAKQVYRSRNAICYQLKKIKEKTGIDPKTFTGLTELLKGVNQTC